VSYVSPDPAFDGEAIARGDIKLDIGTLAKAISWVEDGGKLPDHFLEAGKAKSQTIGITGSPGVGKSTLTSAVVKAIRKNEELVAVLAVDPSSPITGGALLGDRIRMQEHYLDDGGLHPLDGLARPFRRISSSHATGDRFSCRRWFHPNNCGNRWGWAK
jgi:hypothetical protein